MSFNNLSALVGSRICPDLISLIHAIGNGVELLVMEGRPQCSEISLISESVTNANTPIHCFTETMPALTVTLSANALGSALGASGVVGRVFGLGGVGIGDMDELALLACFKQSDGSS